MQKMIRSVWWWVLGIPATAICTIFMVSVLTDGAVSDAVVRVLVFLTANYIFTVPIMFLLALLVSIPLKLIRR